MSGIPVPETGPNSAGFVFGQPGEGGTNKVVGAMPVNTYLVQYNDGAGQKCVRLVFKTPESDTAFILNEKIQGAFTATAGTGWFNRELAKKLQQLGFEGDTSKEGVEAV